MFQPLFSLIILASLVMGLVLSITPAYALTEAQVIERLNNIPVFLVTDDKGVPLLAGSDPENKERVLPFFLQPQAAEDTIAKVQKTNPELGAAAKIIARSMGDIYKIVQGEQEKDVIYQMVPSESSLKAATEIFTGKKDQLPNIPVFYATDRADKNQGLFSVEQGEEVFVPFFFEKQELEELIDRVGGKDKKNDFEVQVTSFFQVLGSMIETAQNKPNPGSEKFTFVASASSFDWLSKNLNQPDQPVDTPE